LRLCEQHGEIEKIEKIEKIERVRAFDAVHTE